MSAINLNNLPESSPLKSPPPLDDTQYDRQPDEQASLAQSSSYTQRFPRTNSTIEQRVQHQVQQHQLLLHRQNSLRLTSYIKKKNDLESKINRLYAFTLFINANLFKKKEIN